MTDAPREVVADDDRDGPAAAGGEGRPLDLQEIRQQIDAVDQRLVALLAERWQLVSEVVHYKRAHRMGVVDRAREDAMLSRIADTAKEQGVDPRVAQQVLRTVIDGFTLLEVEELGPDDD